MAIEQYVMHVLVQLRIAPQNPKTPLFIALNCYNNFNPINQRVSQAQKFNSKLSVVSKFPLLTKSFKTYPIVTWALVGVSFYFVKVGAVSHYQRSYFKKDEDQREAEILRL